MKINTENWTYTHYYQAPLQAFVSFGAKPSDDLTDSSAVEFLYYVTLADEDFQELYQSSHHSLNDALELINQKYAHFEFKDKSENHGDGCSSCAAH